ncbi:MAG TPA: glucosidase, partial [Planctomycetia bacterium]|nr:glucosidase [Planctomycetia bacterium]
MNPASDPESQRLVADAKRTEYWKRWGPYLSERQWGTVREDYSGNGDSWGFFPFDQAASRTYRWGEDGILGITDSKCRLCFALTMWNGKDPILKERLFGLTNPEGNHGEDVKEIYYYLDATPTASYLKGLYKYPQNEFPYGRLREENRRRGRGDREFELQDAGAFDEGRYFDVVAEYAKAAPEDLLIRISVTNRGPAPATIWLAPTLWYRNSWVWNCTHEGCEPKPRIKAIAPDVLAADHVTLGRMTLAVEGEPEHLFCENETNAPKLYGHEGNSKHPKDAIADYIVKGDRTAIDPRRVGTKAASLHKWTLAPGETKVARFRLRRDEASDRSFGKEFEAIFAKRIAEADEFYRLRIPDSATIEERRVARQAYAGLVWTKQFYHYAVKNWLDGDPDVPEPPASRRDGRNRDWTHLFNRDVISMPDKWEYPWYAVWDLAFHMVPFARIDPDFAKEQLLLFLREWYMHPNGQIPAYEWDFNDVNPPVHAWACFRVFKLTGKKGERDVDFLERCFQKLLLNFTWWVNRKDVHGRHLFSGGFLGLDNIGVFDRSRPLPDGYQLEQADGTAWMAFYCTTMLAIALELAKVRPAYEDVASKFFEHFVAITDAMNSLGGSGLWDEEDGFYYDQIRDPKGNFVRVRTASMVGLAPLFAVLVLEGEDLDRLPGFRKRMAWLLENR